MRASAHRGDPKYAPVVIGVITFLISLGLTAALVALDLSLRERESGRELDLTGQRMVDTLDRAIQSRELGLIGLSVEPGESPRTHARRLSSMLIWPEVTAVGHANADLAQVRWLGGSRPDLPETLEGSVEEAPSLSRLTSDTIHIVNGDILVLAHLTEIDDDRTWDLMAIDMGAAAERALPEMLAGKLVWTMQLLPEGEALRSSERLVRRAYLTVDDDLTWLFEFRWTAGALAELGVGIHRLGAAAGIALSTILAYVAAHIVRRKFVQVEREASRGMMEQKDLLLLALSHQLRTPLTAVIGFLDLALDDERPVFEVQRREMLDLAMGQAREAAEIVDDLMVAARINDGNLVLLPKPLVVGPIIDAVFRSNQGAEEVLELVGGGADAIVLADPLRLRQLIRNVFDEGRKEGALRWKVVTTPSEIAVDIAFIANFEIPDRAPTEMLSADIVASPQGLAAIQPHLITATRLAGVMGGDITWVSVGGATAIHVLLPRTYFAADPVGRLALIKG